MIFAADEPPPLDQIKGDLKTVKPGSPIDLNAPAQGPALTMPVFVPPPDEPAQAPPQLAMPDATDKKRAPDPHWLLHAMESSAGPGQPRRTRDPEASRRSSSRAIRPIPISCSLCTGAGDPGAARSGKCRRGMPGPWRENPAMSVVFRSASTLDVPARILPLSAWIMVRRRSPHDGCRGPGIVLLPPPPAGGADGRAPKPIRFLKCRSWFWRPPATAAGFDAVRVRPPTAGPRVRPGTHPR